MDADTKDMEVNTQRKLRFVLPIRTSKRKKEAKSPQQQRDLANGWAHAHRHDIVKVLDSGGDESGKTMDRATIHEAMEMVRSGQADGIVFALTDRLGRAPIEESMAWIRQLNLIGYLALADAGGDPVNLSNPQAESMLVFQLQMARQYWLATAGRFRQSQRDAIKAGKWIGKAPLGFRRVKGRLVEHETNGPIIREAYRRAARDGIHAAVDYLREAVPSREWNTDAVRRLLRSRAYLGENRFVLNADPGNFDAEMLVSPKRHDALTTLDDWTTAQTEPQGRRPNGDYPLSGLVSCEACDSPLVGALQSVHGKRYRRMRCSNPACRGGSSISADKLEAHVHERIAARLGDCAFRLRLAPVGLDEARAALEHAEDERERYATDLTAREAFGEKAWLAGARARTAAVDEARERYQTLAGQSARSDVLPAADEVHDPEQLLRAIRAGVTVLSVRPGRGLIGERVTVRFVGDDLDDRAGMLAA